MRDLIDIVTGKTKTAPKPVVEDSSKFGLLSQLNKMVTEKTWKPRRRVTLSEAVGGLAPSSPPSSSGPTETNDSMNAGGPVKNDNLAHYEATPDETEINEFFDYDDGQDPLPEKSHEEQGQFHADEMERWQAKKGKHHPMVKSHRNAMQAHARADVEPHPERAKHMSKMAWDLSDMIARPENPNMHESFKKVAAKIGKEEHVSKDAADAILASSSRNASKAAKAKNPKLNRVKG